MHGPGSDAPIVWYEGSGLTDRRFLTADERGSIVAVSDSVGSSIAINRYDEYGIPASTNLGRFQYTGQTWLPEVGMYYYKARIYSPTLGRFMQTDPIGYGDGMNMYAYVGNDPVNFIDPTGMKKACKDSEGNDIICVDGEGNDDCETFVCGPSGAIRIRFPGYTFAPPGFEGGGGGGEVGLPDPKDVKCEDLKKLMQDNSLIRNRTTEAIKKQGETQREHSLFGGYDRQGQLFVTRVFEGNPTDIGRFTVAAAKVSLAKAGASASFMIHTHPFSTTLSKNDKSFPRGALGFTVVAITSDGQTGCKDVIR